MHLKILIIFITALITNSLSSQDFSQNQKKYFKDKNNKILDQQGYENLKMEIVSKFDKIGRKVKVEEIFGDVDVKDDSIIKDFELKVIPLNSDGIVQVSNRDYLNKLIGQHLPSVNLKRLDNTIINTSEFNGKPTVINFWFTACKPCIDEFPVLNRLKEKFSGRVNFISITFDDSEKVENLLEKYPFEFEQYVDAKKFMDELNIIAFPTSLFIDSEGIIQRAEGGIPYIIEGDKRTVGDGKEFEEIINELLKS